MLLRRAGIGLFSLLIALAAAIPATAQNAPATSASLKVGDPAPPLTIDTWVKGEPVPELKKGRAYIVEFWATWCGPCRQSIPHLTELQAKYPRDTMTIIGISSSEQKGLADVKPYVEKMGDKMDYTVAFDEAGKTNAAWMQAAGQTGIPTAFIVDQKGMIVWIGHPVYPPGAIDKVIEGVVAGTYDVKAAVARQEKIEAAQKALSDAGAANDTMGVVNALDSLMEADSDRSEEYAIKKFEILVFIAKSYDAGYAWGAHLVDSVFKDRPEVLTAIAVAITDAPGLEVRDYDLAEKSAKRANDLASYKEPKALDALARVHFAKGEVDKAVELQKGAVERATDEKMKTEMQTRLDEYQAKKG